MIFRRRFFGQTTRILLQDDFNDKILDQSKWSTFSISGGKASEKNGRIEFYSPTNHTGGGIRSVNSYDLTDAKLRAKLFSDGYIVAFISIVPYDKAFYAYESEGYSIGIWELGNTKLFIYKNGNTVFRKTTLRGNPEEIEIALDGDTIRFYENGLEVYADTYETYTKNMNIYLWGISWYLNASGTSWADNLIVEAPGPPPSLTLVVNKTAGYIGDTFTFSGFYRDGEGSPLVGYETNLVVNGSIRGSAATGADGSYSIQWTPTAKGTYDIYAEAPSP